MVKACQDNLTRVIKLLVDNGYRGDNFAAAVLHTIGAGVEVAKRSELHTFAVIPRRWVVERSFAWLDKCRRLWKNCERQLNSSLQMVVLAFLVLLLMKIVNRLLEHSGHLWSIYSTWYSNGIHQARWTRETPAFVGVPPLG